MNLLKTIAYIIIGLFAIALLGTLITGVFDSAHKLINAIPWYIYIVIFISACAIFLPLTEDKLSYSQPTNKLEAETKKVSPPNNIDAPKEFNNANLLAKLNEDMAKEYLNEQYLKSKKYNEDYQKRKKEIGIYNQQIMKAYSLYDERERMLSPPLGKLFSLEERLFIIIQRSSKLIISEERDLVGEDSLFEGLLFSANHHLKFIQTYYNLYYNGIYKYVVEEIINYAEANGISQKLNTKIDAFIHDRFDLFENEILLLAGNEKYPIPRLLHKLYVNPLSDSNAAIDINGINFDSNGEFSLLPIEFKYNWMCFRDLLSITMPLLFEDKVI